MTILQGISNFSNLLSLLRLLISIPVFFLLGNMENSIETRLVIVGLLLLAGATDFLDGYFARKLNQITEFGKIIDPLADKVLVGAIVLRLFWLNLIPSYFFYSIIGRDLLILIGGIFVSNKLGKVLPSNLLGKLTVTCIGLYILTVILEFERTATWIHSLFLYSSLILVFSSLLAYIIRAKESLIWNKNESVQEHKF